MAWPPLRQHDARPHHALAPQADQVSYSKDASHHTKPHRRIISDSASGCRELSATRLQRAAPCRCEVEVATYRCSAQRSSAQLSSAQPSFSARLCARGPHYSAPPSKTTTPTTLPVTPEHQKNNQELRIHDTSTSNPEKGRKGSDFLQCVPKMRGGIIDMDTSRIACTPHIST